MNFSKSIVGENNSGPVLDNFEPKDLHDTKMGRIIGQMHNSYIIVQTVDGMQILDQHALAERIIYEKTSSLLEKCSYIFI